MTRRFRSFRALGGAALCAVVLASACAVDSPRNADELGGSESTTTVAPATASSSADVPGAAPAGGSAAGPADEDTAAGSPATTTPAAKAIGPTEGEAAQTSTTVGPRIWGMPDKECAHAGDTQGLTVRGGNPEAPVIYDSVYADKTNDFTTHYGTGSGSGVNGPDRVFYATWVLQPNVPIGLTYINFATKAGDGLRRSWVVFNIVPPGTACT